MPLDNRSYSEHLQSQPSTGIGVRPTGKEAGAGTTTTKTRLPADNAPHSNTPELPSSSRPEHLEHRRPVNLLHRMDGNTIAHIDTVSTHSQHQQQQQQQQQRQREEHRRIRDMPLDDYGNASANSNDVVGSSTGYVRPGAGAFRVPSGMSHGLPLMEDLGLGEQMGGKGNKNSNGKGNQSQTQNGTGIGNGSASGSGSGSVSANLADISGVLKRNQACLNCRRRKLKCDAVRPHCGTCIRSHKHTLKTAPRSNPVLNCDYDDGMGLGQGYMGEHVVDPSSIASSTEEAVFEEPATDGRKKKRKANAGGSGGPGGKKKSADEIAEGREEELMRRIQQLEAQMRAKSDISPSTLSSDSTGATSSWLPTASLHTSQPRDWSQSETQGYHDLTAPSPTALLDILSSAATAQVPHGASSTENSSIQSTHASGLRDGVSEHTMMSGSTGMTPMFTIDTPREEQVDAFSRFQEIPNSNHASISASSNFEPRQQSGEQVPNSFGNGNNSYLANASASDTQLPNPTTPINPFAFSSRPTATLMGFANSGSAQGIRSDQEAAPESSAGTGTKMHNVWVPSAAYPTSTSAFLHIPHIDPDISTGPSMGQWGGDAMAPEQMYPSSNGISNNIGGTIEDISITQFTSVSMNMDLGGQAMAANQDENMPEIGTGTGMDIPNDFVLDETIQQQILMDLFWPGWPPNMPEPTVVNDLVEAFFNLVPNLPRLIHRPRFLARLALPPTHSNFPHPALLHAICASAGAWCEPAVYAKSNYMNQPEFVFPPKVLPPKGASSGLSDFASRQVTLAKDCVQDGLDTGNRLFDVVRAMIILSRVFIDDTRMLECWTYSGLAARMISPLGLNVRSAEFALKSVMLPPAADALEREERRVALWMAFYHDTIGSAASGWGTSLSIDELTAPLPVSLKDFYSGSEHMEANPQDLESPDLWTKHPVVDSFVLCLKATVLLNRATKFVRKWKNRRIREDDDLDGMQRSEFKDLANAIQCFQMSFPPALRNPCKPNAKGRLDIDLISAHMLPHAALIFLYEPFADITDQTDDATRRMVGATQTLVGVVQQVAGQFSGASVDFAQVMHSSASVSLVTSARTSMLFYRQALNTKDQALADAHRLDIEVIRLALSRFGQRFKLGQHHAQLIEYFIDRTTNPSYEKLIAHYPEHPRPGALELHEWSDIGACIINALNIKRGYWKLKPQYTPAGISPLDTPESQGQSQPGTRSATGSVSGVSANLPHITPQGTSIRPLPQPQRSTSGTSASTNNINGQKDEAGYRRHMMESTGHFETVSPHSIPIGAPQPPTQYQTTQAQSAELTDLGASTNVYIGLQSSKDTTIVPESTPLMTYASGWRGAPARPSVQPIPSTGGQEQAWSIETGYSQSRPQAQAQGGIREKEKDKDHPWAGAYPGSSWSENPGPAVELPPNWFPPGFPK